MHREICKNIQYNRHNRDNTYNRVHDCAYRRPSISTIVPRWGATNIRS